MDSEARPYLRCSPERYLLMSRVQAHIIEPRHEISNSGILKSVDSDEPVQPPFKLRHSKSCSISSLSVIEYSSEQQRL